MSSAIAPCISRILSTSFSFSRKPLRVSILDATTYETVFVDVTRPGINTVTISFAATVANAAYYCMVSKVGNLDTAGDLTP